MKLIDKLNCIKEVYPKDYKLCCEFLSKLNYESLYEILYSIVQKENKTPKLTIDETLYLINATHTAKDLTVFSLFSLTEEERDGEEERGSED